MVLFVAIVVFSYIALDIGKYDYSDLKVDTTLAFINPNKDYWFGTDNLGRDYWCQVWYAAQISIDVYKRQRISCPRKCRSAIMF